MANNSPMSNYDRLINWLENQIGMNSATASHANFETSAPYEGETDRWVSDANQADGGNLIITLEDSGDTLMFFDMTKNGVLNYKLQFDCGIPFEVIESALNAAVKRHSFKI